MKLRPQHRAGRHADRWYQETYDAWRRRVRTRLLIATGVVVLVMLPFGLLWSEHLPFVAGLTIGAALAMYMCMIDSPPEWIERKRRGRDAERRTEQRLRKLERHGWTAAHDIESAKGNFDHLLVGPAGAFLLETKAYHGCAEIDNGRLVLHRGDDERDSWWPTRPIDAAVRQAALEAQRRLKAGTGIPWVQGVVVLWSEFPQQVAELDRVFVVHGDHVADWLQSLPTRLPAEVVARARDHLRALEVYEREREHLGVAA